MSFVRDMLSVKQRLQMFRPALLLLKTECFPFKALYTVNQMPQEVKEGIWKHTFQEQALM